MTGVPMGLRLALGRDRTARVRLILMAGGVAAAVALLLGVAGAAPAAVERLETANTRNLPFTDESANLTQGVRAEATVGFWRGTELRVLDVETVGPPVAPPPGLPELPEPGEVYVSPALAEALSGPNGRELAPRIRGEVVGTIGESGLVGPDELFAVAGAPPGRLQGDLAVGFLPPALPEWLIGTGSGGDMTTMTQGISDELRGAMLVAAVGLVVPLMVLVATATRLSAASRERRAAALRLIGATARQVSTLGAIEGAVVGALGTAAGAALFLTLRVPIASAVPVPSGLFPSHIAPPLWSVALVLLGVPALTAVAGHLAVRRAALSPLSVQRQAEPPTPSLKRLLPLTAGLLMLVGALADSGAVLAARWYGTVLLVGGALLCLVGLAVAGPALARAAGTLLARFGPGPASHLAGRRLVMDPAAASRTVTGTALVVVVVGWLLAFLPLLATTNPTGQGVLAQVLHPGTVVAGFAGGDTNSAVADLREVEGVETVVPVQNAQLLQQGTSAEQLRAGNITDPDQYPLTVAVVDCEALSSLLREPLSGCGAATAYLLRGTALPNREVQRGRYEQLDPQEAVTTGVQVTVPSDLPVLNLPDGLVQGIDGFSLTADLLLTELPGSAAQPNAVLVGTNGSDKAIEKVRAALGPVRTPFAPMTAEEATTFARSATDRYAQLAMIGLALVVLVGGISLAVTTADSQRERRNAHAALTAMGAPARLLRRTVLLQTATPLLLTIAVAVAVSAAGSWLYLGIGSSDEFPAPALPWAGYGLIAASAVVASLLATSAALPFVRSAAQPEALRTE